TRPTTLWFSSGDLGERLHDHPRSVRRQRLADAPRGALRILHVVQAIEVGDEIVRTLDTSEAGLIDLVGDVPKWIWAFTCPTPGCDCRTAIVLSTDGDRQTLVVARGSPVRDAWLRGESHAKAAAALDGIAAFAIDIDEGCVFPAYGDNPFAAFDFDAHPGAVRVDNSGQASLEPEHERHRERLEQLWAAFQSRHPRYRERFARRSTVMQGLAGRIVGAPRGGIERRTAKVGHNRSVFVRVRQEIQEVLRSDVRGSPRSGSPEAAAMRAAHQRRPEGSRAYRRGSRLPLSLSPANRPGRRGMLALGLCRPVCTNESVENEFFVTTTSRPIGALCSAFDRRQRAARRIRRPTHRSASRWGLCQRRESGRAFSPSAHRRRAASPRPSLTSTCAPRRYTRTGASPASARRSRNSAARAGSPRLSATRPTTSSASGWPARGSALSSASGTRPASNSTLARRASRSYGSPAPSAMSRSPKASPRKLVHTRAQCHTSQSRDAGTGSSRAMSRAARCQTGEAPASVRESRASSRASSAQRSIASAPASPCWAKTPRASSTRPVRRKA